jgi:hypothetical protein
LAYDQANLLASNLSQQVSSDQIHLSQLETQVEATHQVLEQDAIISYTGGAPTNPVAGYTPVTDPSIRAEYMQIAAGNLDDVMDQYRSQEEVIGANEATLTSQEHAATAAASATASDRARALALASAEQAQLGQLQGRLTELLAATTSASSVSPSAQGLPVNNGLVTVVGAIVAPGTTTTTVADPTTTPPATTPSTTTPSTTPTTTTPPTTTPGGGSKAGGSSGVWLQLRECESGDNYQENTGNGFYGAYQFSPQTWTDLGYPGRPDLESPAMQDQAAAKLQAEAGWGQWPACSAALGLT